MMLEEGYALLRKRSACCDPFWDLEHDEYGCDALFPPMPSQCYGDPPPPVHAAAAATALCIIASDDDDDDEGQEFINSIISFPPPPPVCAPLHVCVEGAKEEQQQQRPPMISLGDASRAPSSSTLSSSSEEREEEDEGDEDDELFVPTSRTVRKKRKKKAQLTVRKQRTPEKYRKGGSNKKVGRPRTHPHVEPRPLRKELITINPRKRFPAHIKKRLDDALLDRTLFPDRWMCAENSRLTRFMPKVVELSATTGLTPVQIRNYMHNNARKGRRMARLHLEGQQEPSETTKSP